MSLRPAVLRRLMRELVQLKNEPLEGIRVSHPDDNMLDVTGIIEGPSGTPYEGGFFRVKFNFTEEFPQAPPKCRLITKIFHPNVSSQGEICVNTLKKDWQSSFGIGHILVTVKCLLIHPNPESALDEEAGKLLLEDYESYCERAKLITNVHATPKTRPPEFNTPSVQTTPAAASSSASSSTENVTTSAIAKPVKSVDSSAPPVTTSSLSVSQAMFRKSTSPAPQPAPQPLQNSASNASPITPSGTTEELLKVTPLGAADANAPVLGSAAKVVASAGIAEAVKAVKRPAGGTAGEKRKKALKRL